MNEAPKLEHSEIGFAVWMAIFGWKKLGGGRGYWKREARRLANDPTEYPAQVRLDPCPASPVIFHICPFCGFEKNANACYLCPPIYV